MATSVSKGGFFDRHPILVPAALFALCWIPYIAIFFRRTISFGDLGSPYPVDSGVYWVLLIVQLGVCVISHSLTIRTIVRLYAPLWLIWGSVAFYALSPAWGLMTAADIRHPLFAAVFCVFTSSTVFALYSKHAPRWLWVQLAGGALAVSLLRADGFWVILPALVGLFLYKGIRWATAAREVDGAKLVTHVRQRLSDRNQRAKNTDGSPASHGRTDGLDQAAERHFADLSEMHGSPRKKAESLWGDVCAAFLVLSAVCLLFFFLFCNGWGLPLGQPGFGAVDMAGLLSGDVGYCDTDSYKLLPLSPWNLTGTWDVAGILSLADIHHNSLFTGTAVQAARFIYAQQCLPVVDLTFSWVAYLVLFGVFFLFAVKLALVGFKTAPRETAHATASGDAGASPSASVSGSAANTPAKTHDFRPLIIGAPMAVMVAIMAFTSSNHSLLYLMPILAAQPMMFGACFASRRA